MVSPEIEDAFKKAVDQQLGAIGIESSPEHQQQFLRGYSWGALVFGPIYFQAMRDGLFVGLSIAAAILFFPVSFILPFSARERAWRLRHWNSQAEFEITQKKWDRAAGYIVVIGGLAAILLVGIIGRGISSQFNQSNSNPVQSLQDLQGVLQQ